MFWGSPYAARKRHAPRLAVFAPATQPAPERLHEAVNPFTIPSR
jgi:hypothetical protein